MKSEKIRKRDVELVVISDVHLGAFGCHADELLHYLRSIRPRTLILNGDIIDIWQFRKQYFPKSHLMVLKYFTGLIAKKTKVIYITGNHDELLRKFTKFELGSFKLVNKLVLELDGKKAWFFHGDVFDVTMQYSKWLTKLGSTGYDILILLNTMVNFFLTRLGKEKISFSRKIKNGVKRAVSYINKFEETVAGIAIFQKYAFVVCGHIHQPSIRKIITNEGEVIYLNSGDWIENLSALEYNHGKWQIYRYQDDSVVKIFSEVPEQIETPSHQETFETLLKELNLA